MDMTNWALIAELLSLLYFVCYIKKNSLLNDVSVHFTNLNRPTIRHNNSDNYAKVAKRKGTEVLNCLETMQVLKVIIHLTINSFIQI